MLWSGGSSYRALPGFGLRIHPSDRKVYIVQARIEGRSRRLHIARYGEIMLVDARRRGRPRLHDLRHTAAGQAVMSGENPPLVGRLPGHCRHRTTAGYVHLVEAVEKVGGIIAKAILKMV